MLMLQVTVRSDDQSLLVDEVQLALCCDLCMALSLINLIASIY